MDKNKQVDKYISLSSKEDTFKEVEYIAQNRNKIEDIIIQKKFINFSYRFFNSLIPFNFNFYKIIGDSPDAYGPFIIYTVILFIVSGLDVKLIF